jgi:CheY-like chemotaxis protein
MVLLVDDDAEWRGLFEGRVSAEGMQARGAARGEHAIATHRADIVVLDVDLPRIDGLHILDMVRHRWPMLPVIVMTAFGGRDTREFARRLEVTAYSTSPSEDGIREPNEWRDVRPGMDIMIVTPNPVIYQDGRSVDRVTDAVKLMKRKAARRLSVRKENRAVGIASLGDVATQRDRRSAPGEISATPANR